MIYLKEANIEDAKEKYGMMTKLWAFSDYAII